MCDGAISRLREYFLTNISFQPFSILFIYHNNQFVSL